MRARAKDSVGEILINGQPTPIVTSLAEKLVEQARTNEEFHAALRAFNAEPRTFANLYVAMEIIKRVHDPSPQSGENDQMKRGGQEIARRGWANEGELLDFNATANLGERRHGFKRGSVKAGRKEITLDDAIKLVRHLLHRWAETA
jgi:hypothetical protein